KIRTLTVTFFIADSVRSAAEMAAALRAVLAVVLPLLSGAIIVKELPNSTDARAAEQPQQMALIQEHAAVAAHSSGIPFIGTSVQLSLTQIIDPIKQSLLRLKEWIVTQLASLDAGLTKTQEMPEKALEVFATKLSALFEAIDLQLQPVTSKLSADSPAIDGLSKVLTATGHPGVADKITEVMDAMSKQVQAYEKTLSSSADVADGLKNLTKDDWHKAGPKIEELKKYLDTGASAIKSFGDTLQAKVEEALTVLAGSLGVEASVFSPISQAAGDGWHYLGDSSTALAAGIVSSSQMLPPEIKDPQPDKAHSGAAAGGALLGSLGAALAAALVLSA
ncbi:unnamed protein product, partial [Prorocentrum cordatum]